MEVSRFKVTSFILDVGRIGLPIAKGFYVRASAKKGQKNKAIGGRTEWKEM
jgi:hypothetical protein